MRDDNGDTTVALRLSLATMWSLILGCISVIGFCCYAGYYFNDAVIGKIDGDIKATTELRTTISELQKTLVVNHDESVKDREQLENSVEELRREFLEFAYHRKLPEFEPRKE